MLLCRISFIGNEHRHREADPAEAAHSEDLRPGSVKRFLPQPPTVREPGYRHDAERLADNQSQHNAERQVVQHGSTLHAYRNPCIGEREDR